MGDINREENVFIHNTQRRDCEDGGHGQVVRMEENPEPVEPEELSW